MDRDKISEDVLLKGLPSTTPIEVQQEFNLLLAFSFVQRVPGVSEFRMHPLIHVWARVRLRSKDQQSMALEALQMLYRCDIIFFGTLNRTAVYSNHSTIPWTWSRANSATS